MLFKGGFIQFDFVAYWTSVCLCYCGLLRHFGVLCCFVLGGMYFGLKSILYDDCI